MLDNGKMRSFWAKRIDPVANSLLKIGITPDAITIFGASVACLISFVFIGQGSFLVGGIALSLAGLSDLLDGTMARLSNTAGPWGAFLDSTLDRVVDGAIYGSLIFYYVNADVMNQKLIVALMIGLISAQITSYTRARWESLGVRGKVGLVERSERMIVLCTGFILTGLGLDVLATFIYFLAVASTITVIQRILFARKSLKPQSAQ